MTTDTWNPQQYDKFQREREQPFFDLLAMVRGRPGIHAVDLGCGTGKLTRTLHEQLGAAATLGLDRSPNMLAAAQDSELPAGLRFEAGTIEDFAAGGGPRAEGSQGWDLIFSNAALHWVDGHENLLRQLVAALAPAGQLAFQVPAQHDTLTHRVAEDIAASEPFASAFGAWRRSQPVLTPDVYARLLYSYGCADPRAQLIVYPHVLASREDVVEWVKGTTLTEYQRHLPADVFEQFFAEYRRRLLAELDDTRPFFFPFKRILCWGQRA
jgi:trans-aconitate 2-methyltransferase